MGEIECPKVLVVGDCAVGKSSVIRAVMEKYGFTVENVVAKVKAL